MKSISLPRMQSQLQFHGGSSNALVVWTSYNGKEIILRNFIFWFADPMKAYKRKKVSFNWQLYYRNR